MPGIINSPDINKLTRSAIRSITLILICACFSPAEAAPKSDQKGATIDRILTVSESLFKMMKSRRYADIWPLLSRKSQISITESVLSSYKKTGIEYSSDAVVSQFRSGDSIAVNYWEGYLGNFSPDSVLEESRWEIGEIKEDEAEILITHRRSKRPARLKMFLEEDLWRVGLVETFRKGR